MSQRMIVSGWVLPLCLASFLAGCGGGGSAGEEFSPSEAQVSSSPDAPISPPPAAPVTSGPEPAELESASKFATQTTFGLSFDDLVVMTEQSPESWLEAQFQTPVSKHLPIALRYGDEYGYETGSAPSPRFYSRFAFFENAMTAGDPLRQRVAYALSQIFVVSGRVDEIGSDPVGLASYYDMLLEHAFGNYEDLLRAVTLHPVMGVYLSHVNNAKSDPAANTFPDENFAREVMQLFSIGLFELEPDGTRRLDSEGQPIPTYDNSDIREFSKVFTGLTFGRDAVGNEPFFGRRRPVLTTPMVMVEEFHEPGEKLLLNGLVVPDGQSGLEDVDSAISNLYRHPNVGPFFGRLLIQRLVKSNPSPEYLARVSLAFEGDGQTPRGDMRAVLRAILLDPEARAEESLETDGKVREPYLRWLQLHRGIGHVSSDGTYPVTGTRVQALTGQHVFMAPSVFNFYLPDYAPPGALADMGLVAPELQIVTDSTVVGWANLVASMLFGDTSADTVAGLATVSLDLAEWESLAADPNQLLDRIDLLFTSGTLSNATREAIASAIAPLGNDLPTRARVALYLALVSPDFAVEL